MKNLKMYIPFYCFIVNIFLSACGGSNIYDGLMQQDTKSQAADNIQSGNYDKAILLLNGYLSSNASDYSAQSMLANAYMLKAGINLLDILVNLTDNINNSKNDLYAIINSFPAGTSENIAYLNLAIQALSNIPSASMSADQKYQSAFAYASLAFLTVKKTVLTSSGTINPDLSQILSSITTTDANTIYDSIVAVQSTFRSLGVIAGNGTGNGTVLNILNQITETSGASNLQKLATFIYNNA